jgi:cbb3-type cytochrome oxidase subunit 3
MFANRIMAVILFLLFIAPSAFAMNEEQAREFDRIANLSMPQLTEEAAKRSKKNIQTKIGLSTTFPSSSTPMIPRNRLQNRCEGTRAAERHLMLLLLRKDGTRKPSFLFFQGGESRRGI